MTTSAVHLLDLTPELLAEVVAYLDPVDASNLSCTCKTLSTWLYGKHSSHLWKVMFLQLFDPLESASRPGFRYTREARIGLNHQGNSEQQQQQERSSSHDGMDYMQLVKERCRARGITRTPHSDKRALHRASTIKTLHDILISADNRGLGTSKNAAFLSSILSSRSNVTDWLTVPPPTRPSHQPSSTSSPAQSSTLPTTRSMSLAAAAAGEQEKEVSPIDDEGTRTYMNHLRLAGITHQEGNWFTYKSGQQFRETVYRGANFSEENIYGPFEKRSDGKRVIDWGLLNAIAQVMSLNVRSAWHQWAEPEDMGILPYGFDRAVFWKQPGPGRDWAGVEGRWNYIYAFIDYNDFFAFNFTSATLPALRPMTLEGISEAVGGVNSLRLRLLDDNEKSVGGSQRQEQATTNGHVPSDNDDDDDDDDDGLRDDFGDADCTQEDEEQLYPPLRFIGESTGPQGSVFRGTVRIMEDGNRHWTFIIHYSGSDRWQTECIEVAGRGVYGIWSDVMHEELSPCGPVWYFRD